MKRNNNLIISILLVLGLAGACKSDFLEIPPKGSLDQNLLATEKGINALLIGAYSLLDGVSASFGWEAASSNWVYGSIRGMEANKGTDSGDQPDINPIQTFSETSTNPYLNVRWRSIYEAISRCNGVIIVTNQALEAGSITQDQADLFVKQAKALRGWYHFEAYRLWEKIPYVDETTIQDEVTNAEDPRPKIIADMQEGLTLPLDMGAVGRWNKTVVQVLLAKAMMQMNKDYAGALPLLTEARTSGTKPNGSAIGLAPTYGEIFDIENRNGVESIYTVQYSVNDGSGGNNGGNGEVLNFPYKGGGSPGGCCGFFNPTQEFVNSFRTSGGLPMLDHSYNTGADFRDQGVPGGSIWSSTAKYAKNAGVTVYDPSQPNRDLGYKSLIDDNTGNNPLTSGNAWELVWTEDNSREVDPRLDWSVGRRGIPYWDWGVHTGSDWIRDQTYSGPYSPKKQVYKKSQEGRYTEVGNWTSGWTANGYRMIRYSDLVLLIAECQIETGDLAGALENINLIRNRAANPAGFVRNPDGTPAANYQIAPYTTLGTQDNAREVLRMERKLELGQEGHRWFDLNRWGITQQELSRVLAYERTMPWGSNLYGSATVGPEDKTFPIPQRQIDLSQGKLQQNR